MTQTSHEIEDEYESIIEVAKPEPEEPQFVTYETTGNETIQENYQRAIDDFNDTLTRESQDLDSWLSGIKGTLLVSTTVLPKTH
jgi:hypothetical protein